MELKSVSGFTCYVKDLDATAKFYESLGFRLGNRDDSSVKFYLNWYSITFVSQSAAADPSFKAEAEAEHKGAGLYINVKVDDVDEFYAGVVKLGMKPTSQPRDWPWGNREFVLHDPDGYKLVFFSNSKSKLQT